MCLKLIGRFAVCPAVPRVVAVSPQMRLVEDNPSSLSLVEIYKQRCAKKGIEHDNPISRYYDRLATVQARGTQASHQVGRGPPPAAATQPETPSRFKASHAGGSKGSWPWSILHPQPLTFRNDTIQRLIISLIDGVLMRFDPHYRQTCGGATAILMKGARVVSPQAKEELSAQVLRDILKEVQGNMVPRSMLKEWALHTFPNATDYWTFRKMFTIQLALIGLAEFMLHLNRLNPEMLQIAQVEKSSSPSHLTWVSIPPSPSPHSRVYELSLKRLLTHSYT